MKTEILNFIENNINLISKCNNQNLLNDIYFELLSNKTNVELGINLKNIYSEYPNLDLKGLWINHNFFKFPQIIDLLNNDYQTNYLILNEFINNTKIPIEYFNVFVNFQSFCKSFFGNNKEQFNNYLFNTEKLELDIINKKKYNSRKYKKDNKILYRNNFKRLIIEGILIITNSNINNKGYFASDFIKSIDKKIKIDNIVIIKKFNSITIKFKDNKQFNEFKKLYEFLNSEVKNEN